MGMTSFACKCRGVEAVIVDGPVTDVYEIVEMGLPVYAKAITALLVERFLTLGIVSRVWYT